MNIFGVEVPNEFLNFIIVFLGVTWRTVRPWLKKYKAYLKACEEAEGKLEPNPREFGLSKYGVKFSKRFLITGGISFVSILAISAMVGALQQNPSMSGFPLFMWAIGQTEVINREIL